MHVSAASYPDPPTQLPFLFLWKGLGTRLPATIIACMCTQPVTAWGRQYVLGVLYLIPAVLSIGVGIGGRGQINRGK